MIIFTNEHVYEFWSLNTVNSSIKVNISYKQIRPTLNETFQQLFQS